jgi:hypothetical protein
MKGGMVVRKRRGKDDASPEDMDRSYSSMGWMRMIGRR